MLFCGFGGRVFLGVLCRFGRFDFRSFLLYQPHNVVNHLVIGHMMIGHARQINHVLAIAATGQADVGFAASPGPLTTQPMIDKDKGVAIWARRCSKISTVLIT